MAALTEKRNAIHAAHAEVADARTHAAIDSAMEVLVSLAREVEHMQPESGKDVQYYSDRFGNSDRMDHKRWFARGLLVYASALAAGA